MMENQHGVQDLYLRVGNTGAFAEYWSEKRWVCWDSNKIPHQPIVGSTAALVRADSTNPDTWGTLHSAFATLFAQPDRLLGIGFVLNGDGLVCIDLDKCVFSGGEITPEAQPILDLFRNTYAEYSPSGTGIHIWLRTTEPLPVDGKRKDGVEIYQSKRYITITGNRLAQHPDQITDCTQQLHQLFRDLFGANDHEYRVPDYELQREMVAYAITDDTEDDELIQAFLADSENSVLWNGGTLPQHPSPSEGDCALAYRLCWLCGGDTQRVERLFRVSPRALRDKLRKRDDLITRAISTAYRYYLAKQPTKQYTQPRNASVWNINLIYPSEFPFGAPRYYAELCVAVFGSDVRYWRANGYWMCYDSQLGIWLRDDGNTIIDSTIHDVVLTHLLAVANNNQNLAETAAKQIAQLGGRDFIPRIRRQMELIRECWTDGSEFDQNPYLIPLRNGVWDVARGELIPHAAEHYITRTLNARYDPHAGGENWEQALDNWCWDDELAMPNTELREYLLHALGYTTTGCTNEQKLFILYGPGANGKSTLLTTMQHLMGGYGTLIMHDVLTTDKYNTREHTRLFAPFKHKRLVIHPELAENAELDAERVKTIVSTEAIPIRELYREVELVAPNWKLWACTNHTPSITDPALWRRVVIIPFLSVFDENLHTLYRKQPPDRNLLEKLLGEIDYIATQLCHYATRWYHNGLPNCDTVRQWIAEAQATADPFEEWFASCVIASPNSRVINDDAYNHYREWMREQEQQPLNKENWGKRMRKKGVQIQRIRIDGTRKRVCLGIQLQS